MACSLVLSLCSCGGHAISGNSEADARPLVFLDYFALSPDGRRVAFEYDDRRPGRVGNFLALFDWESGKLTPIPNPPGKHLDEPSFSSDGERLVVTEVDSSSILPYQISTVDLSTLKVTEITERQKNGIVYPIFQPKTNNILYIDYRYGEKPHTLKLLNVNDHSQRDILSDYQGFWRNMSRPYFINDDEVVFQGKGPADPQLKKIVIGFAGRENVLVSYDLKFGESPKILFPDIEWGRSFPYDDPIRDLSASSAGNMVFIGKSLMAPENEKHQFNMEIFTINKGIPVQLTNIRSYLDFLTISSDGSTAAFASDPTRRRIMDLFIFDMRDGEIHETHLLDRLQRDPQFSSENGNE